MFFIPSPPYALGAVRTTLPQGLRGGSSAGLQPRALPPLHRSPQHLACPPACCWLLLLCPASPRRAQEGLAELSSRPGDLAWTEASPSGMLHLHRASAQRLPTVACRVPGAQPPFCVCGKEQQCWKKVLGYNHGNGKPAQSCLCLHGKGLSTWHPLSASVVLTWQSSASGTKEWFILQRFFPRGHLNIGVGILGLTSAWDVAFLSRI